MKVTSVDVQSVHHAVRTLETKIHKIEGKQDVTNAGVRKLVDYAWKLENSRTSERIQAAPSSSSRPALEMPQMTPSSRVNEIAWNMTGDMFFLTTGNGENKCLAGTVEVLAYPSLQPVETLMAHAAGCYCIAIDPLGRKEKVLLLLLLLRKLRRANKEARKASAGS